MTFPLLIIMSITASSVVYGQKIMKLDMDLKANSTPVEAKRKGLSFISKYEFGPYRIVSGKSGWTATTSHKGFFNLETHSVSQARSSFVMVAGDRDTIKVNTSTNTQVSQIDFDEEPILNQNTNNYLDIISLTGDTTLWKMIIVFRKGTDVKNYFNAEGILTNGRERIQISQVKQWEDGSSSLFRMICGYEFILNGKSIAAVQSSRDASKKRLVWLNRNLDEKMKNVLAAASASLMIHTDSESNFGE